MIGYADALRIGVGNEAVESLRKVPGVRTILTGLGVAFFVLWFVRRFWYVTVPTGSYLALRLRGWPPPLAAAAVAVAPTALLGAWFAREWRGASDGGSGAPPSLVTVSKTGWMILRLRRQWPRVAASCGLVGRTSNRPLRLFRLRGTSTGVTGVVRVTDGRTADDLEKEADAMAAMLRCRDVEVTVEAPGLSRVTFGYGDALSTPHTLRDVPKVAGGRVAYGRLADGTPATVSINTSILVGGVTGSGKSSAVWAILGGLVQAKIPTCLWVLDPAGGVEFDVLRGHVRDPRIQTDRALSVVAYEDQAARAETFIRKFHDAMMARHEQVRASGERKFSPSTDMPLNVLLIDELIPLQGILKKGADSPFGIVLSQGRKAGFIVIAATQAAQVDVLGRSRDLFHQRLCFATTSPDATAVILGRTQQPAHKIPLPRMAGTGYAYDEQGGSVRRFRAAYVSDAETHRIARGELTGEQTALYRWFDSSDRLLYVGITNRPDKRTGQHAKSQPWWGQVARNTVEWHPSRAAALEAEKQAIRGEDPMHNKVHNGRKTAA